MSKFNIKYFLCWKEVKLHWGTLPSGRQEIVKDEWHQNVDREAMAQDQSQLMNDIYGHNTHWIETE